MNRTSSEAKNQSMVALTPRRGFMRKIGAAAAAVIGGAAVMPACAAAPGPELTPQGFVKQAPIDPVQQIAEYNVAILSHLCMTTQLMREWFAAHEDNLRAAMPDQATDLYDFVFEASASARQLSKAAGLQDDTEYVAQKVAEYKEDAAADAGKLVEAGKPVSRQQRALVSHFNKMTDAAQDFVVAVAENNARLFPRERPKLRVVAGGQA